MSEAFYDMLNNTADLSAEEIFNMTENLRKEAIRGRSVNQSADEKSNNTAKSAKNAGDILIMGKAIKGKPVEMRDLRVDSGRVIVRGDVFEVSSRLTKGGMSHVLSFDMTDYTGSIRVSKFMQAADAKKVVDRIKTGAHLTVQGNISFDRYYNDIVIDPQNIVLSAKPQREDLVEEKRVELHLHTRYSALDALCDPSEAVALAARLGHPALAITDHGVAHSFPEVYKAGKKHGVKILYGVEGYYINDLDDKLAVSAPLDLPLDGEFIAFDLETTGLDPGRDRITEIGAVFYKDGEILEKFQTFVNPEMHIPFNITELTGIRDSDVKNAPKIKEALTEFFNFTGGRPLIAHNASFDMGFISAACSRCGIEFSNISIDSLVLAQNLLSGDLKRFKLDIVANHLGLPSFNHHRASDDATTVAYMIRNFFSRLKDAGIENINEINPYIQTLRINSWVYRHPKHIIILVKNQTGLKNLYKLISLSHLKYFKRNPIIPKSVLMEHREGLIIGSACESGEIFTALMSKKSQSEMLRLAGFYDYLEIQPTCNNQFLIASGKARDVNELRELNSQIVQLGKELDKPVIATGDVHFLEPEHEIYRKILLASKKYPDADKDLPIYYKTTAEMLEEFSYLGSETAHDVVIRYPNAIADICESVKPLPDGLFTPKIENSAEELKGLVYGKLRELYGENPPALVTERVETELGDILDRNYDVIYMSAQKLVAKSLEAGYLVGSRGSVGSSIVAFLSGITEVNSLPAHFRCESCRYSDFESGKGYGCGADMPNAVCPRCGAPLAKDGFDIPFATFLGFSGGKVPDIDLNFSGEYQAMAHRHTDELFGKDHVFRAGTIGTIASKTAYGFVKNYLDERGLTVTRAEENRLTTGCVGVKRTTGQHPGGLVIIPQDMEVADFCPVQRPADATDSDIITTHFEYHSMESNLLKLDELGHDDPTMIKVLEDLTGVDAKKIPLDDPDTMSIFTSPAALGLSEDDTVIGKTGSIAVPEFGTKFTREMLVDTQPQGFDTLVRLSGFSHGTDVWLGNAKDLILNGTATVNEVIGSRDDIMLFLISKGMEEHLAFDIMEAIRKGKGLTPSWEKSMKSVGVPQWYIDSCNKIKYMFPKAHAVAYVMMAFRIAWFKVHHPLAFYSAYFSIRAKSFDATIMTRGMDAVRLKLREIDANPNPTPKEQDIYTTLEVCYEFYMRGFCFHNMDLYESDAVNFKIRENGLIPPFMALPGLGETAARDLLRHRNDKDFISIEDLSMSCTKLSQTHIEQLKAMGALGNLPDTSQLSFF